MPLHDYIHPQCCEVEVDYYVPAAIGARAGAPICRTCGKPLDWVPQIGSMDFGPAGGAGFKAFTVDQDVRGVPTRIEIDSLSKLRKVEREFEVHARNGESAPLVWRDYAQTRSNRDVHTLSANIGDPHGTKPVVDQAVKSGKVKGSKGAAVTAKHGTI
jgi:hypothetical protein